MASLEEKGAAPPLKQLKSLCTTATELPPCCLDFCPESPEYFVIGTYKLLESSELASESRELMQATDGSDDHENNPQAEPPKQNRIGTLSLYRLLDQGGSDITLKKEQVIQSDSGILDLAFSRISPKILAVVTSEGGLNLYKLNAFDGQLILLHSFQPLPKSTLLLSLAWIYPSTTSHGDRHRERDCLTTCDSNGEIVVHSFSTPGYEYQMKDRLPSTARHADQAWCVAWRVDGRNLNRPMLCSGGDDAVLNKHNFQCCIFQNGVPFAKYMSTLADQKSHMAGVTALMPFPHYETEERVLMLTGSYDDHVRIYDLGAKRPVLFQLNLGGGVWKLRLLRDLTSTATGIPATTATATAAATSAAPTINADPSWGFLKPLTQATRANDGDSNGKGKKASGFHCPPSAENIRFQVVACCMYAGVRVLDIRRDGKGCWTIDVVGGFEEGGSMAYACDVQPHTARRTLPGIGGRGKEDRVLCVSTSFYDKKVFVWEWKDR